MVFIRVTTSQPLSTVPKIYGKSKVTGETYNVPAIKMRRRDYCDAELTSLESLENKPVPYIGILATIGLYFSSVVEVVTIERNPPRECSMMKFSSGNFSP
jgi:hypothetical protein